MRFLHSIVLAFAALVALPGQAQQGLFDAPVRNPGQKQLCNPCIDRPVNHSGPGTNFDGFRVRSIVTSEDMRALGVIAVSDIAAQTQATDADSSANTCIKTDIAAGPTFQFDAATDSRGSAWYGTRSFAILLRADPVYGSGDKFFWYSEGFRPDQAADLSVSIRRIGEGAATAVALRPTNALFDDRWHMLTGINFPDAGCWEISGRYHGQQLTVVVESTGG